MIDPINDVVVAVSAELPLDPPRLFLRQTEEFLGRRGVLGVDQHLAGAGHRMKAAGPEAVLARQRSFLFFTAAASTRGRNRRCRNKKGLLEQNDIDFGEPVIGIVLLHVLGPNAELDPLSQREAVFHPTLRVIRLPSR